MDAKTKRQIKHNYKMMIILSYVFAAITLITIASMFVINKKYLNTVTLLSIFNVIAFFIFNSTSIFYTQALNNYRLKIIEYRDCHHFQNIMKLLKDGDVQGARNAFNDCSITNSNIRTYAHTFIIGACCYSDDKELLEIAETKIEKLINQYNPKSIFN